MRKFITIISALLLVLILSQCKKKPVVTDNGPEPISITLNVAGGSKVLVTPSTGEVAFENGDVIYVASGGHYVGKLIHNGEYFSGEITGAVENDSLYFYFLGNKTPYGSLKTDGTTKYITVDIIDQTNTYPVISAAHADQLYTGSGYYTAKLANKCALVKFNVTTLSSSPTIITGMNNKVRVDFSTEDVGTFTPSKVYDGMIGLKAGEGEQWAILLPQSAVGAGSENSAYSNDKLYTGTRGALQEIKNNYYITEATDVIVTTETSYEQNDVLPGIFSVSDTKTIHFTKGNLKYNTTTGKWSFHDNQYDMVHRDYVDDVSGEYLNNSNCDIDLFGWGCTGYQDDRAHDNQTHYLPYEIYYMPDETPQGYGPDKDSYNYVLDNSQHSDWGCHFNNRYRTLTSTEWNYVLKSRSNAATKRGLATIVIDENTIMKGLIIIPDDVIPSSSFKSGLDSYEKNVIGLVDWANMERIGAVFLPATGRRNGNKIVDPNRAGVYWTNSLGVDKNTHTYVEKVKRVLINTTTVDTESNIYRGVGCGVRLICDVAAE
ncbi:hypothetical protein [uncultured Methanobrevibacter sp.]|uniref:hypothetical protein n=1 Tax=uncultured Methanobrevibacter sp. TaxID=253161 RepID=UPI00261A17B2|nr:hypothetical protein [uncultured Methanobrevibacter sp.]